MMMDPRQVERAMLVGLADLGVVKDAHDFPSARRIADHVALETLVDPLLLAWFDRKAWKHSPAIC
jgi:hypothetical protein